MSFERRRRASLALLCFQVFGGFLQFVALTSAAPTDLDDGLTITASQKATLDKVSYCWKESVLMRAYVFLEI